MKYAGTLLLLILFCLEAAGQCFGVIDTTGASSFCLSPLANKTFSRAVASGGTIGWISSGDGTFNNNTLQRPGYVPSAADRTRGYVFIYLDVWRDSTCSVLRVATLNFTTMRATSIPATQTRCSGIPISTIVLSTPTGVATFRWTRNNTWITGMPASGTGNISGTLTNNTASPVTVTFTVTPVTNSCTGTSSTCTVIVNPCRFV